MGKAGSLGQRQSQPLQNKVHGLGSMQTAMAEPRGIDSYMGTQVNSSMKAAPHVQFSATNSA